MKKVLGMGMTMLLLVMLGLTDPMLVGASTNAVTYKFVPSTISAYEQVETSHFHTNRSSVQDNVLLQVSRTRSFTGSFGVSVEVEELFLEAGFRAEVGYGVSETITTTIDYGCAANKKTLCEYGSARISAVGAIVKYINGEETTGTQATADYSYASFSEKTEYALE